MRRDFVPQLDWSKLWFTLAVGLLPTGCSNAGDDAAQAYETVKKSGVMPDELCTRAEDVAEAYLQAKDEKKYYDWNITAELHCSEAELLRR